ncbi:hypothetical protein NDU88_008943 [Pleurodeles waltl]|uniref:Uncharacterized protein n=1 Tax=Pleurodeles waltl TaxID=8319 RepID=A0AAV7QU00_PLEWA|nr:hypothetical protein NDU88_008943 [Pleurodeles waltl]
MLCRLPAKKSDQHWDGTNTLHIHSAVAGADPTEEEAPVTRAFLETLFSALRDDIAAPKQQIAAHVREIKIDMGDLGHRMTSVEQTNDKREEEVDGHQHELLELCDKNEKLQYHLEDLEKRSRRSNIRIKGVPCQADSGKLEAYVTCLF